MNYLVLELLISISLHLDRSEHKRAGPVFSAWQLYTTEIVFDGIHILSRSFDIHASEA